MSVIRYPLAVGCVVLALTSVSAAEFGTGRGRPTSGPAEVSVDALANQDMSDEEQAKSAADLGDKASGPAGLNESVVHNPRILWPDVLSLATDGCLYFTSNQLHSTAGFHDGKDARDMPYSLFPVKGDAKPVLLK